MRATNGRHSTSNGLPYTRLLAAFMLATLISTIFALPALAAEPLTVVTTPVATVAAGTSFDYVTTITNPNAGAVNQVVFADTITAGTITAISAPGLTCAVNTPTTASCLPFDFLGVTTPESVIATVTVTAPSAAAGPINNTASATTSTPSTFTDGESTAVTPVADLTIAKSHSGAGTPGSDVTYTLQVNNAGPDPAAGVVVTDSLNTALTFKSSSGCTAVAPPVVSCTIASAIPAGGSASVTFVATIGASVPAGTVIPNTGSVTTTTAESNAGNNTSANDPLTVGAASVDIGVGITVDPTTAAPGDTVTYTVTVTNPSTTTDATGVVVTDALPAGLTAVTPPSAPTTGTAAVAANTWTWTIPTVAKAVAPATSNAVTATFTATVDEPATLTSITNTVTMTSTTTDPVSTNNTATADLTITAKSTDLTITTVADDYKPKQGDTIQIGVQVSNIGTVDATNVVIRDVLPTGLQYDSCEPTPCAQSGIRRQSSQLFSIASIPAGNAGAVILNVRVQASSGTLRNTASIVSADQADPVPANDSDSLNITISGANGNAGGGTGGGGTGGTGGTSGGTGGSTAFTGFTAGQLMPWFMLLASLGLVALEWARRIRLVSPIGSTYGFDPFQN